MDSSVKAEIKQEYQQHEKDTGSVEVQVALLSKRIQSLTAHLQSHKGDHNSRRGLIVMVSKRRRPGSVTRSSGMRGPTELP